MRQDGARTGSAAGDQQIPADAQPSAEQSTGVQSVERALDLLEALAGAEGVAGEMGLTQLAETTGLPYATISRLLRTLQDRGYVRRGRARKYSLGARTIELGDAAGRLLGTWSQPFLAEVMELSGETANLALLEGLDAVYVAQVASRHSVRMFTEVGARVALHRTSVGKVLLAHRPERELEALLPRLHLVARTARSIGDLDRLRTELATVRQQGYAVDSGEEEAGVRCVAVPVFGAGDFVAAMSVSGPAGRLTGDVRRSLVPQMQRVSAALTESLTGGGR